MSEKPVVAIVGAGQVGMAIARNIVADGTYGIVVGARDPAKTKEKLGPDWTVKTVPEAIAAAAAVVLAVPGAPTDAGIRETAVNLGHDCAGKVILDATNPLTPFPALGVRWGSERSGGEVLAEALPRAHVFKAFNTVGVEHIARPDGSVSGAATKEDMLVAGDSAATPKALALGVVESSGFRPRYVGPIRYARNLEAMAELWIHLSAAPIGDTDEVWGRGYNFAISGTTTVKD